MGYVLSESSSVFDSVIDSIFDSILAEGILPGVVQTTAFYKNSRINATASAIPIDGTPPLNTEGALFFTLNHTMLKASNLLDIWVVINMSMIVASTNGTITLFDNAVSNVLAASTTGIERSLTLYNIVLHTRYAPNKTTPITFSIRGGAPVPTLITVNGIGFFGIFSNIPTLSGMVIYEIEP